MSERAAAPGEGLDGPARRWKGSALPALVRGCGLGPGGEQMRGWVRKASWKLYPARSTSQGAGAVRPKHGTRVCLEFDPGHNGSVSTGPSQGVSDSKPAPSSMFLVRAGADSDYFRLFFHFLFAVSHPFWMAAGAQGWEQEGRWRAVTLMGNALGFPNP